MGKLKDWIFATDEEEYEENFSEEVDADPKTSSIFEKPHSARTSEAVKKFGANKDSQLVLFEPRAYGETQEIATFLKQKKAAVVNLHRLQKEQSKRVIDFLSGVIFAIDGDIQKIGPKIFLCTPKNIGVDGSITMEDSEDLEG
ncbi:MAG: cell division protein SepF [Erysipelotrichaceae bacterium]|nr:cell division protein SepF [Erysipelotrichaceae bacterium]